MFNRFEKIVLINLPERTDRKRDSLVECDKVAAGPIEIFPAIRPADKGAFRTVGEHGCFLSHKTVWQSALGAENLLILEDDVSFARDFAQRVHIIDELPEDWEVLYAGHDQVPELKVEWPSEGLIEVDKMVEFICLHCYAINGPAIPKLHAFAEKLLEDSKTSGFCMTIDGAINIARRELGLRTYAAIPPLATQRPSRTDVWDPKWFDKIKVLEPVVYTLRKVKGMVKART